MDTPIFVSVISAAAIIVAPSLSFFLTKKKEREDEWRKRKFEHYREYLEALNNSVMKEDERTPADNIRLAQCTHAVKLVASKNVIDALVTLLRYAGEEKQTLASANEPLDKLMLAMRSDLGVSKIWFLKKEEPKTFLFITRP
jgi:hypothetical protein